MREVSLGKNKFETHDLNSTELRYIEIMEVRHGCTKRKYLWNLKWK